MYLPSGSSTRTATALGGTLRVHLSLLIKPERFLRLSGQCGALPLIFIK